MWSSSKQQSLLGTFLLSGGILALFLVAAQTAQAQSIALHWDVYNGVNSGQAGSVITTGSADGIQLPDGSYNANWTNVAAGWYGDAAGATNLPDSTGGTSTVSAYTGGGILSGNYGTYWYDGSYTSTDPLLNGPWGRNNGPIPTVITGIPASYSSYEIIGYTNPPYGPAGDYTAWLDGTPATPKPTNAPVPGSMYYFSPDSGSGTGMGVSGDFDMMTNNSNSASFTPGNTVVWTGLSGSTQTLWAGELPTSLYTSANNYGFIGFEIVNTSLAPDYWATAVSGTWSQSGYWTGGSVPNANGATAVISVATSGANYTVTLNAPQTVGFLDLGSGSAGYGYTLSGSGGNTLTFSNTANSGNPAALISVTDGAHSINAPVVLVSSLVVSSASSNPFTLTFGTASSITDNGAGLSLTMNAATGVLNLSGSNGYGGGTIVSAGTLQLGNVHALGTGGLTANGGVLDLAGNSVTVPSFTGSAGTITTSVGPATLTVNQSTPTNFGGSFQNGGGGALSLTLTGGSTLTLTGTSTATGPVAVNGSGTTLQVYGSVAAPVNVGSLATLTGTGTVNGLVSVASSGTITPPTGILTLGGGLTVADTTAKLVFVPGSAPASSQIAVTCGAVSLPASTPIYVNPTFAFYGLGAASSTYNLITTPVNGLSGTSFVFGTGPLTSISSGTISSTGFYYRDYDVSLIDNQNNALQLSATLAPAANLNQWSQTTGGTWSASATGNWTRGFVPGLGDTARFGGNLAAPDVIDFGGVNHTVTAVSFSNALASYTLGTSGQNFSLIIDDTATGGTGSISVAAGTHTVQAPVQLNSNSGFSAAASSTLNVIGGVSGVGSVTMSGAGSVNIVNAAGGTIANAITVNPGGPRSLGSSGGTTNINGSITLINSAGLTLTAAPGAQSNFIGAISGNGPISVPGGGVTTLLGPISAYTGTTTVSNGTLALGMPSDTTARTIILNGGTLALPAPQPQNIAVHWSGYAGGNLTPVTGPDGVVLNSNWNNVGTNWFTGNASNLVASTGGTTTAAVNNQGPTGAGTCWAVYNSAYAIANGGNVDNVLVGPGGGLNAVAAPMASAITGIPYASYEIIAYANNTNGGSYLNMWLDSSPGTSSSSTNAPLPGTSVYFGATVNTSTGYLASFVPITNTTPGTYPAGNYTVWSGLSGSSQTIWLNSTDASSNYGITGFEIVNTGGTATCTLPNTALNVTDDSTISGVGNFGTLTLGGTNTLNITGSSTVACANTQLTGGTGTLNVAGGNTLLTGPISGTGSVTLTGVGSVPLNTNALSASTGLVTVVFGNPLTTGALQFGNTGSTCASYTLAGAQLTLSGASSGGTSTVTVLNGTPVISAPVQIASGGLAVNLANNSVLNISGAISDDNGFESLTLAGDGTGQLILSGTNTYGGGTTITSGRLAITNPASLGAAGVAIGPGILEAAATFTDGHSITLTDLGATIQVDASLAYTNSGTLSGTGGLNVTGPGKLVLSGSSGFNGALTLESGTLILSGTGAYGGATIVNGGTATLDGYSANGGGTIVNGGTLFLNGIGAYSGGTTVNNGGTLFLLNTAGLPGESNLTVGSGGTFDFDPSQTAPSVVAASRVVAVPEPSTIALLGVALLGLIAYARRRK